ncbi:MAG: hypothetical protein ACTSUM_00665 [Alphaproteobacteria bacterium]|nr:MAG: hypothetical protein B6I23_00125 [Rickettsiaceae bacterium 4572_127]
MTKKIKVHYIFNTPSQVKKGNEIIKDHFAKPEEDIHFPHVSGATSRFGGTYIGEHLKKEGANISYHHVSDKTGAKTPKELGIEAGDIVFLIKGLDKACADTLKNIKDAGIVCGYHIADPHYLNTDDVAKKKRENQIRNIITANFIVATSDELNKNLTANFKEKTIYTIKDAIDTKYKIPNWLPKKDLTLTTTGYAKSLPEVHASLDELKALDIDIEYKITSALQRKADKDHGAGGVYEEIQSFNAPNLNVILENYTTLKTIKNFANADVCLIPSLKEVDMTEHKAMWTKAKGNGRVIMGINAGLPVITDFSRFDSYREFGEKGAFWKGSISKTIKYILSPENTELINAQIIEGQKIIKNKYATKVLAEKYLDIFEKELEKVR